MSEETKTSSWKVLIVGISLIIAAISGCTANMFMGGNPADAIQTGIQGTTQGVQVIKSGELSATQ